MRLNKFIRETDWVYFVFLFLFTNQAIFSLKILGLLLIYLVRPNLKFGFKNKRLPLFYILILSISTFTFIVKTRDFSAPYIVAFLVGNFFWLAGFLAFHQGKVSIEKYGAKGVENTMKLFTVFNLLFSLFQLFAIMDITHTLNPYTGLEFPYGMSTGDNIYGFFMQNSYFNMMVSAMLTIYFIFKRSLFFAVISSLCLILVFGNYGTMVFLAILGVLLITGMLNSLFNEKRGDGVLARILNNASPPGNFLLYIPGLAVFVIIIYGSLSPENTNYIVQKLQEKVYSINPNKQENYSSMISDQKMDPRAFTMAADEWEKLKNEERRQQRRLSYDEVVTIGEEKDDNARQNARRDMTRSYVEKLQGKTLSILETSQYLRSSPANLLLGAGTTRFSSLTAQKMAGYDSSRLFQNVLPRYISPAYKENHLMIHEERRKGDSKYLSNANWPDSTYNQLFGEYGILGFLCFLVFYLGYFARKIYSWTYSYWVIIMLIPFMHLAYIFETLSVIPFFELLTESDKSKEESKSSIQNA